MFALLVRGGDAQDLVLILERKRVGQWMVALTTSNVPETFLVDNI